MFALTALDYFGIQQSSGWPTMVYTVSVYNTLINYGGTSAEPAASIINNYYPFLLSKINGNTYQNFSASPINQLPQVSLNQPVNILPIFANTSGTSAASHFSTISLQRTSPLSAVYVGTDGYGSLTFDSNYQTASASDFLSFDWRTPTQFKTGPFYTIFNVSTPRPEPNNTNTNPGISIIPQRLVLFPTSIQHLNVSGNDVWSIQTSAAILDTQIFRTDEFNPLKATLSAIDGLQTSNISSLSPISSSLSLAYELKALYATNNTVAAPELGNFLYSGEVQSFTLPCIPSHIGGSWQNINIGFPNYIGPRIIRPDSIEWKYSLVLKDQGPQVSYSNNYSDEASQPHYNSSGYINFNISTNQQLFSSFDSSSKSLSSWTPEYTRLLLYPYNGNYTLPQWAYTNNNVAIDIQLQSNVIYFHWGASAANISAFNLSTRFIADLPFFTNTNWPGSSNIQDWIVETIGVSSLSGLFINNSAIVVTQPVNVLDHFTLHNGISFQNIPCNNYYPIFYHEYTDAAAVSANWVLMFPPHYYSYKASLAPTNGLALPGSQLIAALSAEAAFNYYLSSSQIDNGSGYIVLSSWLYTNYNASVLGLSTCRFTNNNQVYTDQIYFDLPIASQSVINNLQLSAGHAPNYNQLIIPLSANRWFPAISAERVTLGYINHAIAQTQPIAIRPKLSTFAGFTDCFKSINVTIDPQEIQQFIPITVLEEHVGSVTLSIAGLTSLSTYPFEDLRGSYIQWSIAGPGVSSVSVGPIISSINANAFIANNDVVIYDRNDEVVIFNYGISPITIAVSSAAIGTQSIYQVNTSSSTTSAQSLSPAISLLSSVNQNFIRTFACQLTGYNGYLTGPFNSGTPMFWFWIYDNVINPGNVSAVFTDGVSAGLPYNWHTTTTYDLASGLTLLVEPPADGQLNIRNLNVYASVTLQNIITELTIPVDDFPTQTAANTVYSIAYSLCANTPIFNVEPNNQVFTRPADGSNVYTLKANTSSISLISAVDTQLMWLSSNVGQTDYQLLASGVSSYQLNLSAGMISALDITLSAINVYAYGWENISHNIFQTGSFYTIPSSDFYTIPKFIIYPPYTWTPTGSITLLDNTNYSLAIKPSAYDHHINGYQDFLVSATLLPGNTSLTFIADNIVTLLTSFSGSILVPINPTSLSISGLPVTMQVRCPAYPSTQSNQYTGLNPTTHLLYTSSFPSLTAQTLNAYGSTGFNLNPTILSYPRLSLTLSSVSATVNLGYSNQITVYPNINNIGTPLSILLNNTSITYTVSSPFWTYTTMVTGNNPITFLLHESSNYNEPLSYTTANINLLKISAEATTLTEISATPSLWNTEVQNITASNILSISAYEDRPAEDLFVSQYYQITGKPIRFQLIPNPIPPIVSGWAYNMGDGSSTQLVTNVDPVDLSYNQSGTMILNFTAFKVGGTQSVGSSLPLYILPQWSAYNQENFRSLSNTALILPYSLEEIQIQPNEFGVSDIFNTAITRLYTNLEYLKQNSQTLNPNIPKLYYGWLGTNSNRLWRGLTWSTIETNPRDYQNLSLATNDGFTNLQDACWNPSYLFVLDNGQVRIFLNNGTPQEITNSWRGYNSLLQTVSGIASIWIDQESTSLLIANQITNKISIFNLDTNTQTITFQNSIGSYGSRLDPNKFYAPTFITKIQNQIYVLDYNNACVKAYTDSLGYQFTYYTQQFDAIKPISFDVHTSTGFVYILTQSNTLFIFEPNQSTYIFDKQILPVDIDRLNKIWLDETGEFFYVASNSVIYKFTASGNYVSSVIISEESGTSILFARAGFGRQLLVGGQHYILVLEDHPTFYTIGDGSYSNSWSLSSLSVKSDQFSTALNYNQSFSRFVQNLKDFRRTINARFALVTERATNGVTYVYFALNPIIGSKLQQLLTLGEAVEANQVLVGENELHTAQTLNRPLTQLFNGLEELRSFLSIEPIDINGLQTCAEPFCWSWKSMSLADLSLPVIFICGTNPISFEELMSNFPFNNGLNTTLWRNASSQCCLSTKSPLN